MIDCEKCKYYHKNCNAKLRCQVDVEQIRADAIDECIKVVKSVGADEYSYNEMLCQMEQLKEKE